MKNIILWLWQFPQHLLALLLIKTLKAAKSGDFFIFNSEHLSPFSLGSYIFFEINSWISRQSVGHEHGHSKQSLILGWLYLPLIGLPSVIGNLLHRFIKFDYYKQPWEAWADRLGGVTR
jgi:hypothetical protein